MELDFNRSLTCCFTGHRLLSDAKAALLLEALFKQIRLLHTERGYSNFLCGGAVGFDQLAAEAVLALRAEYPAMRLYLLMPFPGYDKDWADWQRAARDAVLREADGSLYTADAYSRGVYYRRDRMLVHLSSVCVAYLQRNAGGTFYTASYADDCKHEIINLANELPKVYNNVY